MKATKTMSISEYADSLLYKGKRITTSRVWQLIKDGDLKLARQKPALVVAKKID